MSNVNGGVLFDTFQTLGIYTGNISANVLDAWFDTECEDTKRLLNWLCSNLSINNVLTPQENEEYEELEKNGKILTGETYEQSVSQLCANYPGILEPELISFEVECHRHEIEVLKDQMQQQNEQLKIREFLSDKLTEGIHKLTDEEIVTSMQKEEAFRQCLEVATKVDNTYFQLQEEICKYSEQLCQIGLVTNPTFISDMPLESHRQFCTDVLSYVDIAINKETFDPELTENREDSSINSDAVSNTDEELDDLCVRMYDSICDIVLGKMEENKFQTVIQFLKSPNAKEVIRKIFLNGSYQLQMEANMSLKMIELDQLISELRQVAKSIANNQVDLVKLGNLKNKLPVKQYHLERLNVLDDLINDLLANQFVRIIQLDKEKCDVKTANGFFKKVFDYINNEMQHCVTRTDSMLNVINEYNLYKSLPIEKRCKLIQSVNMILSGDKNVPLEEAVSLVNKFMQEKKQLNKQLFHTEFLETKAVVQKIQSNCAVLKKFLSNGPTNKLVAVPYQLLEAFREIDKTLMLQENSVKSSVQLVTNAEKKIAQDKWFRIRRQLWMQFLTNPNSLQSSIQQIIQEIKEKRNAIM